MSYNPDFLCDHYESPYECEHCKKDPATCEHVRSVGRWHHADDKLIKASGFCYDCGKDLKLNREKGILE